MGSDRITVYPLPERFKHQAVQLYVESLETKLEPIFGSTTQSLDFLLEFVDLQKGIGVIDEDQVLGVLGLQDQQGGFLCPTLAAVLDRYGLFAGLYKTYLMMALDPELRPDQVYLDGIAVAPEQRGQGIGTQLISAFEAYGRWHGFRTAALDVVNTNPRARTLYLKLGYQEVESKSLEMLGEIFHFQTSIRMEKLLNPE